MTVNVAKTEVRPISGSFDVDSICAAFGGAKVIPYSKLELLGSPIGPTDSPDQLSRSIEIRLEQIVTFGQSLCYHHRLFLLKHCVSIPRLLYMIRSSPCFLAPEALRNIDASFRQFLTETLNVQLDDKAWRQASLLVKAGGLGVRRIEDLALPAYLSSSSAAEALVLQIAPSATEPFGLLFSAALEAWSATAGMRSTHLYSSPPPSSRPGTHHWSPTLSKTFSPERVSRTLCVCVLCRRRMLEVANCWELIHRPSAGPCSPTKRSGLLRASGSVLRSYLLTYASIKSRGRFSRHENMKEIVGRALRSAGLPTRLEPLGLCRGTNNKRPDGETLVPWQSGQPLAFDVTCMDSFAPSRQHCLPGAALVTKEAEKRAKYADLRGHLFSPVAVETLGRWGAESFAFLKELGRRLNSVSGDPRSSLFLRHRLSVAVIRGNCLAVLGSIPGVRCYYSCIVPSLHPSLSLIILKLSPSSSTS